MTQSWDVKSSNVCGSCFDWLNMDRHKLGLLMLWSVNVYWGFHVVLWEKDTWGDVLNFRNDLLLVRMRMMQAKMNYMIFKILKCLIKNRQRLSVVCIFRVVKIWDSGIGTANWSWSGVVKVMLLALSRKWLFIVLIGCVGVRLIALINLGRK